MLDDGWHLIENAPTDGSVVQLRRVHEGRIIAEGRGLFGVLDEAAPARTDLGIDPLGRFDAAYYERERQAGAAFYSQPHWLRADRMHLFPEPTHWKHVGEVAG